MASDQGSVATEPSLQPAQHAYAAEVPQASHSDAPEPTSRANPLKRSREHSPSSPSPSADEPSHKTTRFTPRATSPIQLTAAVAALEAERRRREDMGHEISGVHDTSDSAVLESLIRSNAAMSQPPDSHHTPAPTASMDTADKPENSEPTSVSIPMSTAQITSADSTVLGANGDSAPAGDGTMAGPTVTESPGPMDIDPHLEETDASQHVEKSALASHSYPGPLHMSAPMAAPSRNMSYPGQASPPSAGRERKEHKCPTCSTVFTRQHNLKSHMLTHKDEKPYKCEKCDMRFRRLHDLKRHSKLHTGEKPHICPKCDRKFARGDALARHNKGAGGCAGRRSSMGTFIDDEANASLTDADDSRVHDPRMPTNFDHVRESMDNTLYAKYAADAAIAEEERMRQQGLSGMKAPPGAGSPGNAEGAPSHGQPYARGSSGSGGLFPPGADRNSVSTETHPQEPRRAFHDLPNAAGQPTQESPAILGQELEGLTQCLQYGRRDSDRRTPPTGPLRAGTGGTPKHFANASTPNGPTTPQSVSRAGSGAHVIDNSNNMFAGDNSGLWTYMHALEDRVAQLEKGDREKQAVITALATSLEALQKPAGHAQEVEGEGEAVEQQ